MIIYKTFNRVNGKVYIGKSINEEPSYLGSGVLIKRAIKLYGRENFDKEIISRANDILSLNYLERFFISVYSSKNKDIGYNISDGGDGGSIIENMENKEEIYKRRGESLKLWNSINKSTRLMINSNISSSLALTAEQRGASISKSKTKYKLIGPKKPRNIGPKKLSESHRENLSKALIGNRPSNCVKIEVNGDEFESLNDASTKLGIKLSTLRHRIRSSNYPTYIRKE